MGPSIRWKMNSLLAALVVAATAAILFSLRFPCREWVHFSVYLGLVVLASGLQVRMPGGDSTISINFPFILLTIIEASPLQAAIIATVSVYLQCTKRNTRFTREQVVFNVTNTIVSTVAAWIAYSLVLKASDQIPPAVAAAILVYFGVNLVLVTRMISWASGQRVPDLMQEMFLATAPYYLFAGDRKSVV